MLTISAQELLEPLQDAVLAELRAITEINSKVRQSCNALNLKDVALSVSEGRYGQLFSEKHDDIDLSELTLHQEKPVMDLRPANALENIQDKMKLLRMIAQQFMDMDKSLQAKVIFLGDKHDIALLMQADHMTTNDRLLFFVTPFHFFN